MPASAGACFPQKLHAIRIREAEIQNQGVIGGDAEGRIRIFGAANRINDKTAFGEVIRNHLAHRGVVLDQQYLHAITSSAPDRKPNLFWLPDERLTSDVDPQKELTGKGRIH